MGTSLGESGIERLRAKEGVYSGMKEIIGSVNVALSKIKMGVMDVCICIWAL